MYIVIISRVSECPFHNQSETNENAEKVYLAISGPFYITLEVNSQDIDTITELLKNCDITDFDNNSAEDVNFTRLVQTSLEGYVESIHNRLGELSGAVVPFENFLIGKATNYEISPEISNPKLLDYIEEVFIDYFSGFDLSMSNGQLKTLITHTHNMHPIEILAENSKLVPNVFKYLILPAYKQNYSGTNEVDLIRLMSKDTQIIKDFLWNKLSMGYNSFLAGIQEMDVTDEYEDIEYAVVLNNQNNLVLDSEIIEYRKAITDQRNSEKKENANKLMQLEQLLKDNKIEYKFYAQYNSIHNSGIQGHCPIKNRNTYDLQVDLWFRAAEKFLVAVEK